MQQTETKRHGDPEGPEGTRPERREFYRVPYRELADLELAIVLETAKGERFKAEIIDLSVKGVGTRFQGRRPSLRLREEVTIEITLSGYRRPTRIPAYMRSGFQAADWCRYGFEFAGDGFPAQGLAGRIYGWFNRRSSPRVPILDLPVELSVERSSEMPLKGRMMNVSFDGCSVELACSESLQVGKRTTIRFALGEAAEPLSFCADVQSCDSNGRKATVGLEFQGPFDREAKKQIYRFVIDRLGSSS